jgi:hypothetical protein
LWPFNDHVDRLASARLLKFFCNLPVSHYFVDLVQMLAKVKWLFQHKFRVKGRGRLAAALVGKNDLLRGHHASVDIWIDLLYPIVEFKAAHFWHQVIKQDKGVPARLDAGKRLDWVCVRVNVIVIVRHHLQNESYVVLISHDKRCFAFVLPLPRAATVVNFYPCRSKLGKPASITEQHVKMFTEECRLHLNCRELNK